MADRHEAGSGVGGRLKQLRESRRMSLRQIANITKMSVPALEAIERNDIKKLPGGLFARSFVRAYARELGQDVEPTVQEYFAQFPGQVEPPPSATVEPADTSRALPPALVRAVAVGVPVLALLGWAVIGWTRGAHRQPEPLAAERIPMARPEGVRPATLRPTVDVVPAIATPAAEPGGAPSLQSSTSPLTLHVTARKACWLTVSADGREVVSRLLGIGEKQAIGADSELQVKVGDASAVVLWLNGSPVRALGGPGEVVTLRIDAGAVAGLLQTH